MAQTVAMAPSKWWRPNKKTAIKTSLVLVVAIFLYLGYVLNYQWVLIGWCRGQPRYKGLPSDYWRVRVQGYESWIRNPPIGANDSLVAQLYYLTGISLAPQPPFRDEDGELLGVLLVLIKDSDPQVRSCAAKYLGSIQPTTDEAIDALILGLDDPPTNWYSLLGLEQCGPAAKKALPKIIEEFEKWKRLHPPPGPELARSPAEATQLANRYQGQMLSSDAGRALQSIDPEEARKRGITLKVPP